MLLFITYLFFDCYNTAGFDFPGVWIEPRLSWGFCSWSYANSLWQGVSSVHNIYWTHVALIFWQRVVSVVDFSLASQHFHELCSFIRKAQSSRSTKWDSFYSARAFFHSCNFFFKTKWPTIMWNGGMQPIKLRFCPEWSSNYSVKH